MSEKIFIHQFIHSFEESGFLFFEELSLLLLSKNENLI